MKTIKGPAIFLAQFAGDERAVQLASTAICGWAASLGYKGVQIPTWDGRLFDLEKAADSKTYCDEVKGTWPRSTASRSPSSRPTCRASSSPSIRPIDEALRRLRARRRCAATRRRARNGRSSR